MRSFSLSCVASLLSLCIVACGDSGGDHDVKGSGGAQVSGDGCPAETPEFAYGDNGLEASADKADIVARILDASSSPPKKYENTWKIVVSKQDGTPLDDAQIVWACSYMPAHGHGAFPEDVVKQPDGEFDLDKLNLFMEGGWEVQLWVDPTGKAEPFDPKRGSPRDPCREPSGAKPNVVFSVCVPRE
jgi:hypothetical protein